MLASSVAFALPTTICNTDLDCRFDICTSNAICSKTAAQLASGQPGKCDFSKNSGMSCGTNSTCRTSLCDSTGVCIISNKSTSTSCNDANLCTTADHCNGSGTCVAGTTDPNCCTSDAQCSIGEKCQNNKCVTTDLCVGKTITDSDACTTDSCDPATGAVTHTPIEGCCTSSSDCSASSDCYTATCSLNRTGVGTCSETLKPIGVNCSSGLPGVCSRGQTACTARGGYICDSINNPTTEICDGLDNDCDGSVDEGFNVGASCSTGSQCKTGVIQCVSKSGTAACVATNLQDGTSCSDNNACTDSDTCVSGTCVAGAQLNCNDNNACTTDVCDPAIGCDNKCLDKGTQVTVNGSIKLCQGDCKLAPLECLSDVDCESKNDADQCNGKLRCNAKGVCALDPTTIISVPASTDPCRTNACDPATGNIISKAANEGTQCDDGKLLTINDKCVQGACTGTTVECLSASDCAGNACSTQSCVSNKCVATAISCDDGNVCTSDSCDAVTGCKWTPILSGKVNACGGCADLSAKSPGSLCGACSDGTLQCKGIDDTECAGASASDADGDLLPDLCDAPDCGNGFVEAGESCDLGMAENSDLKPNGCRTNCQLPRCGDGVWDNLSESCDDGNNVDDDLCRNDCSQPSCGDGITSTGESCDSGDMNGMPMFCNATCSDMTKYCGDGIIDASIGETCDTLNVGDEIFGEPNFDGKTCESLGHKGGGELACVGCNIDDSACVNVLCGDGVVDDGEACDGAVDDPIHQRCDELCQIVDIPPACGNTVVDGDEECDPSVAGGDETCRENCTKIKCGDGIIDSSVGEECDSGLRNNDHGACTTTCTQAICGDGLIQRGVEACDSGLLNGSEPDACRSDCSLPICGDGIVDVAHGEVCDQSSDNNGKPQGTVPFCNAECSATLKWCGNGIVDAPNDQGVNEECDGFDGVNIADHEACNESCMKVTMSFCGDGIVQSINSDDMSEACDDGNNVPFDGCSPQCQKEICTENDISACDDGKSCTKAFCNMTGDAPSCGSEVIADCCESDADCLSAGGCMVASCINNSCVQSADPLCCTDDSGVVTPAGMVTACSNGACQGTKACRAGAWTLCSAQQPLDESCNGVDDNCNGLIDENISRACSSACGVGVEVCTNGSFGACNAPQPSVEICDGIDNDCDNLTDEDLGTIECAGGVTIAACVNGARPPCPPQDTPIDNSCDDGDPCTTGDMRNASGACIGQPKVCVDTDACTTDSCDSADGQCKFVAIEGCGGELEKTVSTVDTSKVFDLKSARAVALPFEVDHIEKFGSGLDQVYYAFGCNGTTCGAAFMPMSALRGAAKPEFKVERALAGKEFVAVGHVSGVKTTDLIMRDDQCLFIVPQIDVQLASLAQTQLNVSKACLADTNVCENYEIEAAQVKDQTGDALDEILVKLVCAPAPADTEISANESNEPIVKYVQLTNSAEKPGAFTSQLVDGVWREGAEESFRFGSDDAVDMIGAAQLSAAFEKVFGGTFGTDVGRYFTDDAFAVGEEDVAVANADAIRLAKVKIAAVSGDAGNVKQLPGALISFEPYPETVENYICRAPRDGIGVDEITKYAKPMFIENVVMKNFGGPDLSAVCSFENENVAFFYPNKNEPPSVKLVDQSGEELVGSENIIGDTDLSVSAKGSDPTNDALTYKWECKDKNGADCSAVFTDVKAEEVGIVAASAKSLIEGNAPDMSLNVKEGATATMAKDVVSASAAEGYACPLTVKVTATDAGGLSGDASAQLGCLVSGKVIGVEASTKAAEAAGPTGETYVSTGGGGLGWAAIGGGGCSLIIRR